MAEMKHASHLRLIPMEVLPLVAALEQDGWKQHTRHLVWIKRVGKETFRIKVDTEMVVHVQKREKKEKTSVLAVQTVWHPVEKKPLGSIKVAEKEGKITGIKVPGQKGGE